MHANLTGEPCNKIVTITDSWVGGYTTALKVHVKNSISTWEMDITFSSSLTNLEVIVKRFWFTIVIITCLLTGLGC